MAFAQQDPQFGQYMMNPNLWNPSYSGLKKPITLSFHHRTQWLGYTNSDNNPSINPPSTQMLTATTQISRINSGIGFGLMNDNIGPIKNQNIYLSYSYYLKLGEGKIAAGIGLGANLMTINSSLWRPENSNDPTLVSGGSINQYKPLLRFGLSYSTDKFYIGLASNNVSNPTYNFGNNNISSSLVPHYYLQSSYRFSLSEGLEMQPSFLLKKANFVNSLEISNLFFLHNFWFGASYRTSDALIFLAGIQLLPDKSLKFGYNFDLTVINAKAKSVSSHEIFLSYNLGSLLDNKKPIIRSPRYRF